MNGFYRGTCSRGAKGNNGQTLSVIEMTNVNNIWPRVGGPISLTQSKRNSVVSKNFWMENQVLKILIL